jgi:HAE1 family hydrophobic/amphiphilic exporter-1
MNLTGLFIVRPVMTTLVMAALVIFGVISYTQLPVNDLPSVDFPTITVTASVPGANADTMAATVATPLERQFTTIAGLDNMNSTSSLGSSSITLQFDLTRKIDGAAQDVQTAINAARNQLPANMPTPPTFKKVNPADSPILFIAVSSPTQPLYAVDEFAETWIANRLSMVSGVAQVQVYGSQIYSVHIQMDPQRLAGYGIGVDDVVNAVQSANVNIPTGTLYGEHQSFNVMANGQLYHAKDYAPLIIAYHNGAPVRMRDIGNVIDSVQMDKVASWYNQTRAVVLAVQRQPNTNTIQIVDNIKAILPTITAAMPQSVHVDILYDRSVTIRKSISDVQTTLLITVALVILVIFLFLGNISSTVIPSLALPISIFGTFAFMHLLNFSINNLSLLALTLSVGFVVDDAIVVVENIVRHIELGKPPMEAALIGAKEIGFTILSMTLSLVAVFIPILLMQGIVGRLFNEFAVTISVAILISGFISLSLTPMLCSRFLKFSKEPGKEKSKILHAGERAFEHGRQLYAKSLQTALRHKRLVMAGFAIMVVATFYLAGIMPKGFLPNEDMDMIMAMTEAAQGISFDDMVRHQQALAKIIAKNPNVQGFMSSVGAGGPNAAGNGGRMFIVLKPAEKRKESLDQVIQKLRPQLAKVPGIRIYMQNPASIKVGGQTTKGVFQYTLQGSDTDALYTASAQLLDKMKQLPQLQDVNTDLQVKNLQVNLEVNRDKCAQLGISVQKVQDALNSAYSARQVTTIYTPTNEYWVIVEVEPKYYRSPEAMHLLYVRTPTGLLVPLDTLAKRTQGVGPLLVNHVGQFPSVTISFNQKPGYSLGQATQAVDKLAASILPSDITGSFQGTAQIFQSSLSNLGLLLCIAIIVIYIVLGILYESFIHPITILSGLPSAGLGAILILLLFHIELDLYGFLGLILLIGIVKKNAIMMIDFALDVERHEGKPAEQAIYEACLARFRPIMMTTMCALMGAVPIAVGFGAGSEGRRHLGLAIIGGLLVSQLVTLYITPVFYIYLDRLQKWLILRKSLSTKLRITDK